MIPALPMPDDRRFRRTKIRPVRRRRAWLARTVAVGQALVVVALTGFAGLRVGSRLQVARTFAVNRIDVHGNVFISTGEILMALDELRGVNIFRADLAAARARLLRAPWVEGATLRRNLPNGIDVTIVERVPMGLARLGADLYLIDADGVVIDQYGPNYLRFELPILEGFAPVEQGEGGPVGDTARVRLAARVLRALATRRDLLARVSEIDVSDPYDATVILSGETTVLHLGSEAFVERLAAYLSYASVLRDKVGSLDYVDLRFGERVYVRPVAEARPPSGSRPISGGDPR